MSTFSKKAILLAAISWLASACATTAPQSAWVKSQGTSQEFYEAKDQCLHNSQRRETYADAGDVVITDWNLFSSCLNSQGWSLQSVAKD